MYQTESRGAGVYTVTRTPLQRVEELLDGVTDGIHAIQQDVNNVSAGLVIVIDGVEDFLVNAGAVCFQVIDSNRGSSLLETKAMTLPFASATSSLTAPAA